jgi:hypothetical protein
MAHYTFWTVLVASYRDLPRSHQLRENALFDITCRHFVAMDKSGKETVLHTFTGVGGDGMFPYDDLLLDAKGNLYGTTFNGGTGGCFSGAGRGLVFRVTP